MKYLEDFQVGETRCLGRHKLTLHEIIDYSCEWDPHPIHTEPDSEEAKFFGGVIAAGTHLVAITIKLLVQSHDSLALIAGLGWDKVRFHHPGRPGDLLSVDVFCQEVRPSKTKRDRGIVQHLVKVTNQDGELVLSYIDSMLLKRGARSE